MTPRERVLGDLAGERPDAFPFSFSFTPDLQRRFEERTGTSSPAEYFSFDMRSVGLKGTRRELDFSGYLDGKGVKEGARVDEWGVARNPGSMYHFTKMVHPLSHVSSPDELEGYPWPDQKEPYRHAHLEEDVQRLHEHGLFVCGGVGHIFETSWYMRGLENLLSDFALNPEFADALLDRVAELTRFRASKCAEAGCDLVTLGDDVGMQTGMMMSPETWRRFLKRRLARVISAARSVNPRIHVYYHSDGDVREIIPDLVEVGVDVLNPVQPECMDPAELRKTYPDLSFWGTIGTQTTMPFGTPQEVKRTVRRRIEDCGARGRLVLAPTHVLEPDVPLENVFAFVEAVREWRED